jgi:undecaprenyl-diphosphatase
VCAIVLAALVVLVTTEASSSPPSVDAAVAERAADLPGAVMTPARMVTAMGATPAVVVLVVVAVVVALMVGRGGVVVIYLAVVLAGQALMSNAIKGALDRARPDVDQLVGWSGASFPSGHSTAAAAVYLAIALTISSGDATPWRPWLVAGAIAVAVLVGASRIALGVHWLTDVLAGLALGWGWAALCAILILEGRRWGREAAAQ